jgi:hypothetical protein
MTFIDNMIDSAIDSDPVAFRKHFESAISERIADAIQNKKQEVAGTWLSKPMTQEEYEQNIQENVIPEVLKMIKQELGSKAFQKLQAKNLPTLLKVVGKYANLHAVEGAKKIADMSIKHFAPTDTSIDKQ